MSDKNKEEKTNKHDKIKIIIYISFSILGLLLLSIIIYSLYSFFYKSTPNATIIQNTSINNTNSNTNSSINNSSNSTTGSINTNSSINRSKYMSSLFKKGGFCNRFKRFK